jgi:hypothetical protein
LIDPLFTLIPISVLSGVAALWVFGRLSNQRAIEKAKQRVAARLYELRLFVDEPKLIAQALAGLIRDNLRYLTLTLLPGAAVAIPMVFLITQLDAFYGYEPLQPGQSTLVTVQSDQATLTVSDGFIVETPPVRIPERGQISWRVRALRPASGTLRATLPSGPVTTRISAEPGLQRLASRTPIEIDYPVTDSNWMLWFFLISMTAAFLLRRRLGVSI